MNTDGTRMAVGAPKSSSILDYYEGYLRVYQYDQTKTPVWQQMGPDDIVGSLEVENRGTMVSMSGDGTRVASIGSKSKATVVQVHEWNSESQSWTAMPGFPLASQGDRYIWAVAISSDGTRVAFVKHLGNGMYVLYVYEFGDTGSGETWFQVGDYQQVYSSADGYAVAMLSLIHI